jgi:hypothetical protein
MSNSSSPGRRTHWFPNFVASLYLVVVATLVVMPILKPDGRVTESPSLVFTLPTFFIVLLLPMKAVTLVPGTGLILIAGIVNAIILYILSGLMVNWFGFRRTIGIGILGISLCGAIAWFFNDQDQKARVRIVNGGANAGGVWIAADDEGLRVMSNQPLIPPTPFGFQFDVPTNTANDTLVFVPNQTRNRQRTPVSSERRSIS